jgi:hypothetical protein
MFTCEAFISVERSMPDIRGVTLKLLTSAHVLRAMFTLRDTERAFRRTYSGTRVPSASRGSGTGVFASRLRGRIPAQTGRL